MSKAQLDELVQEMRNEQKVVREKEEEGEKRGEKTGAMKLIIINKKNVRL